MESFGAMADQLLLESQGLLLQTLSIPRVLLASQAAHHRGIIPVAYRERFGGQSR